MASGRAAASDKRPLKHNVISFTHMPMSMLCAACLQAMST